MGSDSDWSVMSAAAAVLTEFDIAHEVQVVSAHRTPAAMIAFGSAAAGRGIRPDSRAVLAELRRQIDAG